VTGFVLHPEAYTDLDEIWEYIAADNVVAADRGLDEIYQMLRSLVFPTHSSHPGSRLFLRGDERELI
jgi:plasmid stabilization system protein ParE